MSKFSVFSVLIVFLLAITSANAAPPVQVSECGVETESRRVQLTADLDCAGIGLTLLRGGRVERLGNPKPHPEVSPSVR